MKKMYSMKNKKEGGFTLLELLIVIAIIAILSVALVIVLNPSETLKKSRDAQRISDLSTLKTAIGLYMTSVSPAYIGGVADNGFCKVLPADAWTVTSTSRISYSVLAAAITQTTGLDGGTTGPRTSSTPSSTDGNGWIPVNFNNISGGSPISNIPLDPINTVATSGAVASTDLVYRYGCATNPLSYEIDAQLESTAYTVTDNKRSSDGGNNSNLYETGTNLNILGTGTNF